LEECGADAGPHRISILGRHGVLFARDVLENQQRRVGVEAAAADEGEREEGRGIVCEGGLTDEHGGRDASPTDAAGGDGGAVDLGIGDVADGAALKQGAAVPVDSHQRRGRRVEVGDRAVCKATHACTVAAGGWSGHPRLNASRRAWLACTIMTRGLTLAWGQPFQRDRRAGDGAPGATHR